MLVGASAAGMVWGLGSFVVSYLSTHPIRVPLWRTPRHLDLPFEDVTFLSRDGLRLSGWFMPSPGAQAGIILCHGHPVNRVMMLQWARVLYPAGFHLLLFDFRAMGRSGGNLCSIGHDEVADLLGAVDYLVARPEMNSLPVGVFGLSMGGAVSLMAAAQDERIAAVATHGAYASLDRAIAQRCRLHLGPLGPAMHRQTAWWGRRWVSTDPRCVSPLDVIHRIAPRPVLLFHGRRDVIIHPNDARALYHAAGDPKELHWLPRSGHFYIHRNGRAAYDEKLLRFFRAHLT